MDFGKKNSGSRPNKMYVIWFQPVFEFKRIWSGMILRIIMKKINLFTFYVFCYVIGHMFDFDFLNKI